MAPIGIRSIVALALISLVVPATAQKADDEKMAREALAPYIGKQGDADRASERINKTHDSIRSRAANNPEKEMSVVVVFNQGQSVDEIATLAEQYQLEIIDLHLKAPYDGKGKVQSFKMGSSELARYEGEFSERANTGVGVIRHRLLRMAKTLPDDVARAFERIAKAELLIYRIEAYGRSPRIVDLLDRSQVVAAVMAESAERGEEKIEFQKRMRSQALAGWERIRANGDDVRAFREKHRDKLEEGDEKWEP